MTVMYYVVFTKLLFKKYNFVQWTPLIILADIIRSDYRL